MMWDTFPTAMTDDPALGPPLLPAEFDWNMLGAQGNDPNQPGWTYWPQGPQESGMGPQSGQIQ